MTPQDEYLREVRRGMLGMEPKVQGDILQELNGHIAESTAANGGNVSASLSAVGSPREIGRHYRQVYGYGIAYKVLFAAIAGVLAIPSVPVLAVGTESLFPLGLSLLFLIGAAGWILWVSVVAGSRAGLFAGTAGFSGRIAAFAAIAVTQAGATTTPGGLGLFVAVSVLFVVLGWIPGTAKKVWSGPQAEL